MTVMSVVIGALGKATKVGKVGKQKTNPDHPNYSNVEIGQNIGKSPGHPRKLAVTHTPLKDHQPTLV